MEILKALGDCVLALGESDEYSFVFKRQAKLFNRRREKILTTIVSQFSAMYVYYWPQYMSTPLKFPPSFDGRIVIYPTLQVCAFSFSCVLLDRIFVIIFLGDKPIPISTICITPHFGHLFWKEVNLLRKPRRYLMVVLVPIRTSSCFLVLALITTKSLNCKTNYFLIDS